MPPPRCNSSGVVILPGVILAVILVIRVERDHGSPLNSTAIASHVPPKCFLCI